MRHAGGARPPLAAAAPPSFLFLPSSWLDIAGQRLGGGRRLIEKDDGITPCCCCCSRERAVLFSASLGFQGFLPLLGRPNPALFQRSGGG